MSSASDIKLTPLAKDDLELLMAWRSHPKIYQYFKKQTKPLTWNEHFTFWNLRKDREDFIISFHENGNWRKVGSINVSALNTKAPEIGILIGELSAHKKGFGKKAVSLIISRLHQLGYNKARVVIHKENKASQRLFTSFSFVKSSSSKKIDWETYILESIV